MFLLFLAISCPSTEIINTSGYPWNDYDQEMLEYSKKRCSELYSDAECVKMFKKYGEKDYSVICGQKE